MMAGDSRVLELSHPMSGPGREENQKPSTSSPSNNPHVPTGECRFIMIRPSTVDQRCSCPVFRRRKDHPGAHCECGHQACYHSYHSPAGASSDNRPGTSTSSRKALLERIHYLESQHRRDRRHWEEQLQEERHARREDVRVLREVMSRFCEFMEKVMPEKLVDIEDRIDGLVDGHEQLRERVIAIDDSSMALEDRILELESSLPLEDPCPEEKEDHAVQIEELHAVPAEGMVDTVSRLDDLDDSLPCTTLTAQNRGSARFDKSTVSTSRRQTAVSLPISGILANRSVPVAESTGHWHVEHSTTARLFQDRTFGQLQEKDRSRSSKRRKIHKENCSGRYPGTSQHRWTLPNPPPLSLSESILNACRENS